VKNPLVSSTSHAAPFRDRAAFVVVSQIMSPFCLREQAPYPLLVGVQNVTEHHAGQLGISIKFQMQLPFDTAMPSKNLSSACICTHLNCYMCKLILSSIETTGTPSRGNRINKIQLVHTIEYFDVL
jgi:hypothetical protein